MSDLGDVLERLHDARGSFQTFRGEFRVVEHPDVWNQALKRALTEQGPRRSRMNRSGSTSRSGFVSSGVDLGPEESIEPQESSLRLWMERPDRFREERGMGEEMDLVVRDGERWWSYNASLGAQTNEDEEEPWRSTTSGDYEPLLDPAELLALLLFEPLGVGERSGRTVYRVRARPRVADSLHGRGLSGFGAGADAYGLEVDAERGVILRVESRFAGQALSVIESVRVGFDEPLAEDTFVFVSPDGRAPAAEEDPDLQHVAVHEAARLAPFALFVIAEMPPAWASFATFSPSRERPPRPAEVMLMYVAADAGGTVIVQQRLHDDAAASRWETEAPVREVIRDGRRIEVVERVPGSPAVRVLKDNTEIHIASPDLDTDQQIELATRLRPAPTAPAAI